MNHRYSFQGPSDYEKWRVRPQLSEAHGAGDENKAGSSGLPPCLFIVPRGVADQPLASGTVADCLLLLPDGRKLDLFEIPLGGPFLHIKTDLDVPDVMPLAFTRCVMPLDDWAKRNHTFLPHVYDIFMFGDRRPYTYLFWVLPDRQQIRYERVSPGTGYADAVFESTSSDPMFSQSRVAWNGWGWDLNLRNGLTVLSPEAYNAERPQQESVSGIFDREGHEVQVERESKGEIRKIISPSGRSIRFEYTGGRLTQAEDSLGKSVKYTYDAEGRLVTTEYSTGTALKYSYDSAGRNVEIVGSPPGLAVENKYGSAGNVEETEIDGETYVIRRFADEVDILGPKGVVTRVRGAERDGKKTYSVEEIGNR